MRNVMCAVVAVSLSAFAAPPAERRDPKRVDGSPAQMEKHKEAFGKKMRLLAAVNIAEALELNEAETLKLAEKLKGFEERRQPVRQAMGEALRSLKAAADGDATAGQQVDQNVQKLTDLRSQMATMDKELFTSLSAGLNAQKKAKLALALARTKHHFQKMRGEFQGRGHHLHRGASNGAQ